MLLTGRGLFSTVILGHSPSQSTLAKTKIIYPKNVGAKVAMDFTYDKYSAPMAIEKIKILGGLL